MALLAAPVMAEVMTAIVAAPETAWGWLAARPQMAPAALLIGVSARDRILMAWSEFLLRPSRQHAVLLAVLHAPLRTQNLASLLELGAASVLAL